MGLIYNKPWKHGDLFINRGAPKLPLVLNMTKTTWMRAGDPSPPSSEILSAHHAVAAAATSVLVTRLVKDCLDEIGVSKVIGVPRK